MNLYPVNLDITDRLCLVIGGGEVAARKIESLVFCGARVVVISPRILEAIADLVDSAAITWEERPYLQGDLDGAFLVFAATDNSEVQKQVVRDARQENVLVNVVNHPAGCTFQVPASVRRGKFLVTVSTGGGSPALAAKIRRELDECYGLEYEKMVDLLYQVRQQVIRSSKDHGVNRQLFRSLLDIDLLELIRQKDWFSLEQQLRETLPDTFNINDLVEHLRCR